MSFEHHLPGERPALVGMLLAQTLRRPLLTDRTHRNAKIGGTISVSTMRLPPGAELPTSLTRWMAQKGWLWKLEADVAPGRATTNFDFRVR